MDKTSSADRLPCPREDCDGLLAGALNGLWCCECGAYGGKADSQPGA